MAAHHIYLPIVLAAGLLALPASAARAQNAGASGFGNSVAATVGATASSGFSTAYRPAPQARPDVTETGAIRAHPVPTPARHR